MSQNLVRCEVRDHALYRIYSLCFKLPLMAEHWICQPRITTIPSTLRIFPGATYLWPPLPAVPTTPHANKIHNILYPPPHLFLRDSRSQRPLLPRLPVPLRLRKIRMVCLSYSPDRSLGSSQGCACGRTTQIHASVKRSLRSPGGMHP